MHSVHSVPLHGFASCTEKLSGEWVKAAPDPKGQAHDIYGFSTMWCCKPPVRSRCVLPGTDRSHVTQAFSLRASPLSCQAGG